MDGAQCGGPERSLKLMWGDFVPKVGVTKQWLADGVQLLSRDAWPLYEGVGAPWLIT